MERAERVDSTSPSLSVGSRLEAEPQTNTATAPGHVAGDKVAAVEEAVQPATRVADPVVITPEAQPDPHATRATTTTRTQPLLVKGAEPDTPGGSGDGAAGRKEPVLVQHVEPDTHKLEEVAKAPDLEVHGSGGGDGQLGNTKSSGGASVAPLASPNGLYALVGGWVGGWVLAAGRDGEVGPRPLRSGVARPQ